MKKIIIILCLILLSGCNINYDLKINENLTYNENINISADDDHFIENIPEDWDKIKSEYSYSENKFGGKTNASLTKNNTDLMTLDENELVKKFVGKVKITEGNNIKIVIIFNDIFWEAIKGNATFRNSVNDIKFSLDVPFEVINANNTSKEGNKLVWDFNTDTKTEILRVEFKNPKMVESFLKRNVVIIIILFVLLVFVGTAFLKYKKNNEI